MISPSDRTLRVYGEWLMRWRWPVIVLTLGIAFITAYGAQFLAFKQNYRVFFGKTNPQLEAFDQIQNTYTKQDNVLFVISPADGDAFTPEVLAVVEHITEQGWRLPFAIRVDSPSNFQHTRAEEDDLLVEDLVSGALQAPAADLEYAREVAVGEPLLRNRLVNAEASVIAVMVTFQLPEKELDEVQRVVAAARAVTAQVEAGNPDIRVRLTGAVMMNNAFFESAKRDIITLVPLMYLGIIITMWWLLRSFSGTVATIIVVALSIATGMGLAGWMGIKLTSPSASAPTVIITLAVADSIHLLLTLFSEMRRGLDKRAAMVESLRINMQPVFLTSLTTAIGFLTMNFSDAPPFHDLGNIVAMGVMAAFVYSVVFLPALIAVLPIRASEATGRYGHGMDRLAEFVIARRNPLLFGSAVIAIAVLAFIPRNELNDEFVKYFDTSIEFRQDTDYTLEHLTGLYQIHYSIPAGESNGVSDPAYLARLEEFAEWYRAQPETIHVSTITDTFKRLNKNLHGDDPDWYRLPRARDLAAQYLLLYELSLPYGLDLNNQLNVDKSASQFIATVESVSSVDLRALVARSEAWLRENTASMATRGIGVSVMFSHISERNIRSMITGTLVGLALISLILIVALRSLKLGLLSLVPNLLPAGLTFGLWGLFVGQVNVAVSVVTAMTLGIVVDDTVHFLSKYLRARRERGLDPADAVRYAFSTVGTALVVTTLILVAGFMILAQSSFEINATMARLTAIAIVLALVVDFLLLPVLLLRLDDGRRSGETTESTDETLVATSH